MLNYAPCGTPQSAAFQKEALRIINVGSVPPNSIDQFCLGMNPMLFGAFDRQIGALQPATAALWCWTSGPVKCW
jgi:hypothetical protein